MTFSAQTNDSPRISVVVPVRNETGNLGPLIGEIETALADLGPFEIVYVNDGSTDGTGAELARLAATRPHLRVVAHRESCGQSAAVRTGVRAARGAIVCTLDGDGQNDPADIPGLLGQLNRSDAPMELALIQGRRAKRIDSGWKKMGSRLANNVRRSVLKDANSDSGCGMRAFRRDAYMLLPYFDHMHRYLPALMMSEGLRVEEREVGHRARQHGRSNYTNFGRLAVAVSDMRGVMWLRKRRRSPGGVDEI
jgi:dolichol-phosphate mannosyltransferase